MSVRNTFNGLLWIGALALYMGLSGLLHAALGRSRLELAAALLATPLTVVFFDWSGRKLSARRLTRQDVLLFAVIGADDAGTDFVRSGRCALRDTRRRWHFFARATKSRGAACDHERCSVGPA